MKSSRLKLLIYLEAFPKHLYTFSSLTQLILGQSYIQIHSEKELTPKLVHHFLAGFELSLALDIFPQTQIKASGPLLNHCSLDLYKVEEVYEATLCTL